MVRGNRTYLGTIPIKCHFTHRSLLQVLCLFHVRSSDLAQTCHGCINHDIVVDLSSKLLMRLSYYIQQGFQLTNFVSRGNQTRVVTVVSRPLYHQTRAQVNNDLFLKREHSLVPKFDLRWSSKKERSVSQMKQMRNRSLLRNKWSL